MSAPHRVAILRSRGDYDAVVPRLLSLAGLDAAISAGESVLIKPNLHATQHWTTGGTVNPALVCALIGWARARGAARVLVADGPYAHHPRPEDVFTETGMAEAVERKGAEWASFPRHPYRIFRSASPHLPPELGVSELMFQFDRIINVALMKTHLDCMVTLAMKNLKGCIRNADKVAFHQGPDIDRAVVELCRLIRAEVHVVDGTVGMEGVGPAAGTPAGCGCILASSHAPSLDAVAASVMGFEIAEVRSLRHAQEAGLLEPDRIETVGERVQDVRRRFERPDEAMRREMPGLRLQADGACSGCNLQVIRALRENVREGIAVPKRLIAIGRGVAQAGAGEAQEAGVIRIGRCQREARGEEPFLPGCPPRLELIREFLRRF